MFVCFFKSTKEKSKNYPQRTGRVHIPDPICTNNREYVPLPRLILSLLSFEAFLLSPGLGCGGDVPIFASLFLIQPFHCLFYVFISRGRHTCQAREGNRACHNCTPEGSPPLYHLFRLCSKPHPTQHTESQRQDHVPFPKCWSCHI